MKSWVASLLVVWCVALASGVEAQEELFIRGDCDTIPGIAMADAIYLMRSLYVPGAGMPRCLDAADVDDVGLSDQPTMGDAMYLLEYLYVPDSPPPPAPFPDCGIDPSEDEMFECWSHHCMDGAGAQEQEELFIRGDLDTIVGIDMRDAIYLLLVLYVPGTEPVHCLDAGDVNDIPWSPDRPNDWPNFKDALFLLKYIYVPGSPPPPPPFPECGIDPTEDLMECDHHYCMEGKSIRPLSESEFSDWTLEDALDYIDKEIRPFMPESDKALLDQFKKEYVE